MTNETFPSRAAMAASALATLQPASTTEGDKMDMPVNVWTRQGNTDIATNPVYMTTDLDSMQYNAGFQIIHAMPTSEKVDGNRLFKVLGRRYDTFGADKEVTEYVTWMWAEGTKNYFWGHYTQIQGNPNEADYADAVRITYHKVLKELIER